MDKTCLTPLTEKQFDLTLKMISAQVNLPCQNKGHCNFDMFRTTLAQMITLDELMYATRQVTKVTNQ